MAGLKGLDIWLETGRKVRIGGRELWMVPLPLGRLKKALEAFDERTKGMIKDFVTEANQGKMDVVKFTMSVLNTYNSTDLVYEILMYGKDPDTGKPLNEDLTKEWIEDNLDIPSLRRLIVDFVEVNEIEEVLKKAADLPSVGIMIQAMTMTYGLGFLKSSQASTALDLGRSETSPSPKSTDTSNAGNGDTPGDDLERNQIPMGRFPRPRKQKRSA